MVNNPPSLLNFREIIVEVSTPQCTGKGILLTSEGLIITHQHIVEGNAKVVITPLHGAPSLQDVLFTDNVHDLAFVEYPTTEYINTPKSELPKMSIATHPIKAQSTVFAINDAIHEGQIINAAYEFAGVHYLKTNLRIDTAFSGSPLLNAEGRLIGIQTGLLQNGATDIGFAIPMNYIQDDLRAYREASARFAVRCPNCQAIVTDRNAIDELCSNCNHPIEFPQHAATYQPEGISRTIEQLIASTGFQPALARRGPNLWALRQGSATIFLSYYEPKGYIMGDAFLCQLPNDGDNETIERIYEYLLRQNHQLKGLTFSIHQGDIVLSLIIYDQHLHTQIARDLLNNLLLQADDYDNILVEQYGAVWK